MTERYARHLLRRVASLEGVWDFTFLGEVDAAQVNLADLEFPDRMPIPACFDATPAYAGRRGLAAYRRSIFIMDETPHRLVFDGVSHWCRVYVNGDLLGEHAGGFSRFAIDLPALPAGEAELALLVDNRFDPQRSPLHLEYFDWYHYGGISRPAWLHRLGQTWIEGMRITTLDVQARRVAVEVVWGGEGGKQRLQIAFDGAQVLEEIVSLEGSGGKLSYQLSFPAAGLWSPADPQLHYLSIHLGEDDLRQRFGIRQVSLEGRQICVNGEAQRLLGFCRHETHPQFGCALPDAVLVADVQQLLDMGCNFVRGSHYPQDPRFLDLCDEAGICVWNEITGWQPKAEHLQDERFIAAQQAEAGAMVEMSYNHPSVILWGALNEGHSHDSRCRPGYAAVLGRLRQLDPTRPVTYACNHLMEDVCLDLADVVSLNAYPGWYVGEIEDIPARLEEMLGFLDRSPHAAKPVIISEIGAGAIPGWRDWNQARWSEQYQAQLLEVVIEGLFVKDKRVCGLSLWQFCDCRTPQALPQILGRPRGFNNKGILDEYRRPKLAYEAVRRRFRALGAHTVGSQQK